MTSPTPHCYPDLSVLLIMDDPTGYDTLQLFLLTCGVRLTVADGAEQGVALFAEELPNLVFICRSENLDPYSLTVRLRSRWGCRAHAVVVGGDDTAADWRKASEAGAAACLPDPENTGEAEAILQRLSGWMTVCNDASQQLLEAVRSTRLLDALPWGVILLAHGDQLLFANRTASRLTGLARQGEGQRLEDLFLLLYGVNRDANLLLVRNALHNVTPWMDTLYSGHNGLTLRLELLPLAGSGSSNAAYHLLTVQDIGRCPTSHPYQTLLSAAAFDLLFFRHYSTREQAALASAILEGTLPAEESFRVATILQESGQQLSAAASPLAYRVPDHLDLVCLGQGRLLKEILAALYRWALDNKGTSAITAAVSLQGRDGDRYCLRFSVTAVDRRLTRSSYQRGDEAVAQQLAQSGLSALKSLRGIGLATSLASLIGSCLILKTVAREGKTAQFDLWLQQADATALTAVSQLQPDPAGLPEPVPAGISPAGQGASNTVLRILAAEDNPLEQLNIKGLMERIGHQVLLVGNGREAVEECEQNSFDLILMDILMPVMDGFEAVRLIREHERLQGGHTPIVALTSYSLKAVQERCAKAGMDGYLPKPVTQGKLEELINSCIRPVTSAGIEDDPGIPKEAPVIPPPVMNLDEAITNLGSDVSFFREMLTLFETHGYPLLDQVMSGLQDAGVNRERIERDAHKLKGMASNIGAAQLVGICMNLQDEPSLDSAVLRDRYCQELAQARNALAAMLEQLDWQALKDQYARQQP